MPVDLALDPASPVPLYRQIVDQVRRLVALGALRPGDRLPTVRDLAVRSRVNRNTAARAVQQLEAEGVVRTRVGQGTFVLDGGARVADAVRDRALDDALDRLVTDARNLGVPPDELPARLDRRIAAFREQSREASAGRESSNDGGNDG